MVEAPLQSRSQTTRVWNDFWESLGLDRLSHKQGANRRMFWRRCLKIFLEIGQQEHRRGRQHGCSAKKRFVRFREARRMKGGARQNKASLVREELWEWFCSIRRSFKTRLPPALLLRKAEQLNDLYMEANLKNAQRADAPVINYEWLRNWRLDYGVSLKKPNRKWKVPKAILQERLETTWLNIFRVRALAIETLGYDLDLWDFDQSPFYMNEAGSKQEGTLSIRGGGVVALREGHSATRERWTMQTLVQSEMAPESPNCLHNDAGNVREILCPHLELMFKAKGTVLQERLQGMIPPWATWLSVVTSAKGSYK